MNAKRYVIMANGKGRRWGNFGGRPKHLIEIDGETLLARTVRLLQERDPCAEIVISSADERCETPGAHRHVPLRNECEIDRFAHELICDDVCFLYGDTYYSEHIMDELMSSEVTDMLFFGSSHTIFAVLAHNASSMKRCVDAVRSLYQSGKIDMCKGWQLYQFYADLPLGPPCTGSNFVFVDDITRDFNSPPDLKAFLDSEERRQAQYENGSRVNSRKVNEDMVNESDAAQRKGTDREWDWELWDSAEPV